MIAKLIANQSEGLGAEKTRKRDVRDAFEPSHGRFRHVSHDFAQLRIHEMPNESSHMLNRPEGISLGGVVTSPS